MKKLLKGEDVFLDLWREWNNPFAMHPPALRTLHNLSLNTKGPILEIGSGLSTLVLRCAAEKTGSEVVSLEDSKKWNRVQATECRWYESKPVVPRPSLVCVDGPSDVNKRHLAFDVFGEEMKSATVFVDDFPIPSVRIAVNRWILSNNRVSTRFGNYLYV